MKEQIQCDCGECEWVQVCTEQANAGKCSYCWDEYLDDFAEREAKQMKMWEKENRQLMQEYWNNR